MLARAQSLEAAGRHIIHLEIGQFDVPTFKNVSRAGIRAIEEGFTRYTPSASNNLRRGAHRRARAAPRRAVRVNAKRVKEWPALTQATVQARRLAGSARRANGHEGREKLRVI